MNLTLLTQVYSSQPNERHADTWGFRGANVNMKDANGNYYIDPNRQLKGTDIQEMRTKGAKIPSGFNTLNDDEIAKLHNTFASNTNNKRSNTMLIMFCLNEAAKDADVSPYMKSDEFEVTIGNLREYQE